MTDAEYVFRTDVIEKKNIAHSARYKKCGAKSKVVTLPSDTMTKKEIEKMNGEEVSIAINKPTDLRSLKYYYKDSETREYVTTYLNHLNDNYVTNRSLLANMLRCSIHEMETFFRAIGHAHKFHKGKMLKDDMDKWNHMLDKYNWNGYNKSNNDKVATEQKKEKSFDCSLINNISMNLSKDSVSSICALITELSSKGNYVVTIERRA